MVFGVWVGCLDSRRMGGSFLLPCLGWLSELVLFPIVRWVLGFELLFLAVFQSMDGSQYLDLYMILSHSFFSVQCSMFRNLIFVTYANTDTARTMYDILSHQQYEKLDSYRYTTKRPVPQRRSKKGTPIDAGSPPIHTRIRKTDEFHLPCIHSPAVITSCTPPSLCRVIAM